MAHATSYTLTPTHSIFRNSQFWGSALPDVLQTKAVPSYRLREKRFKLQSGHPLWPLDTSMSSRNRRSDLGASKLLAVALVLLYRPTSSSRASATLEQISIRGKCRAGDGLQDGAGSRGCFSGRERRHERSDCCCCDGQTAGAVLTIPNKFSSSSSSTVLLVAHEAIRGG